MKAVIYENYGSPDVLQFKEIAKPSPKEKEVLVKVKAVSLNASDWECLRGTPLYARAGGLRKPSRQILGTDIAGRVEAVGDSVTKFQPGDEVFGDIMYTNAGGLAEYACVPEHTLAPKPAFLTFEQAAAYPQAAVIALQGVRNKGQVQPGQKVLINGAGGGTGTFAVQLAKMAGAEVTAVDSAKKFDMLRSIGADHVIDYTQQNYTKLGRQYDFVLDIIAYHSVFAYRRTLTVNGRYYMVGGSMSSLLQVAILGTLLSKMGDKTATILGVHPNTKDLLYMTDLFESGEVVPIIDKQFPLDEAVEAIRYHGEGHALGKVIITVV